MCSSCEEKRKLREAQLKPKLDIQKKIVEDSINKSQTDDNKIKEQMQLLQKLLNP